MKHLKSTAVLIFLLIAFAAGSRAQQSGLSFLALGDSYTIGESVDPQHRWPVQLAEELRGRGLQVNDPRIIAVTGWTTLDLREALSKEELNPPYDLVSLLIGVNDQYQGFDIADYPGNFRYLLARAIELAGNRPGRVLVLSIPDYGVTPFGQQKNPDRIAEELSEYNAINRQVTRSLGAHYIDITPGSRKAADQPDLIADDGLHPSAAMYRQWVEQVTPVLFPQIKTWSDR